MRNVKLLVGERTVEGHLPESFSEMTPEEFLSVVRYRCDVITIQTLIGHLLSNEKEMPLWAVSAIKPYIEFVNSMNDSIDHFIIPQLSTGFFGRKYIAPMPMLRGMSFQQFMSVDNFFQFYTTTQKEEFLYKFVACLYLRKGRDFFGKKLIDIESEAKALHAIDSIMLFALYVNWILIKNWLSRTFKFLFASGEPSANQKPKGTDWLVIFDSFVGEHVADMIAYQKMECMDAFRIMNNKIKNSKRND